MSDEWATVLSNEHTALPFNIVIIIEAIDSITTQHKFGNKFETILQQQRGPGRGPQPRLCSFVLDSIWPCSDWSEVVVLSLT